jgi:DNA-binding CsgD family transcriptional regulator
MNGVTFNTARAQLRSVFGKTGVRRQAELIRLLLGSSASIRV